MSIATQLSRYLKTNASVEQRRMSAIGRTKTLEPINGTNAIPLQLSIWPRTLMWKMRGGGTSDGDRLEDLFQFAISSIDYDIAPGDVLIGYPMPTDQLEVASVNRYDDGNQPMPHLGGVLRKYSVQG